MIKSLIASDLLPCADQKGEAQGSRTPAPENDKATKPAFHVGPSSARQRNAI